jgi:hypothetical protein
MFIVKTEKIHDKVYYQIVRPDGKNHCGLLGIKGEALRLVSMLNSKYIKTGKMQFE